ncbi:acetyl-CoA carboxylase biotin carboxylase subunit family protein [Kitasatospora sp. NPDC056531]|uniref:ATP-grasp domain-containing protein n=1 Tax=Kitasatospora sp. NPDC056531 TaxID=3345856 RepID=UPI0036AE78EE
MRQVRYVDGGFSDEGTGHVVVVHRWQDQYAHYTTYLDHGARPVTYVTTEVGAESVPAEAAEVVILAETSPEAIREAVASLADKYGTPAAIVALKEGDLPVVAQLREDYDTAGRRPAELARFLDKYVMAEAVAELGDLAMPAHRLASSVDDVLEFAGNVGWPVIAKPLRGSASHGVRKLENAAEATELDLTRPMIVQSFLPHPVIHVDGLCTGTGLGPWRASGYVSTCLSFTTGTPLGSVEIDDPKALAAIEAFLTRLMPGLCDEPWVFHLELFLHQDEDGNWNCAFLEVGSRVGGGDIPWIWREVHGIDLMWAEVALQLGNIPVLPELADHQENGGVGGFLMMPLTVERPCRVVESSSMVGPEGPYAEKVVAPGGVIPAADAYYEHVGGRFRFRGETSAEVEAAVHRTIEGFRLVCEPLVPVS